MLNQIESGYLFIFPLALLIYCNHKTILLLNDFTDWNNIFLATYTIFIYNNKLS